MHARWDTPNWPRLRRATGPSAASTVPTSPPPRNVAASSERADFLSAARKRAAVRPDYTAEGLKRRRKQVAAYLPSDTEEESDADSALAPGSPPPASSTPQSPESPDADAEPTASPTPEVIDLSSDEDVATGGSGQNVAAGGEAAAASPADGPVAGAATASPVIASKEEWPAFHFAETDAKVVLDHWTEDSRGDWPWQQLGRANVRSVEHLGMMPQAVRALLPQRLTLMLPESWLNTAVSRENVLAVTMISAQVQKHLEVLVTGPVAAELTTGAFCLDGRLGVNCYLEMAMLLLNAWHRGARRHVWISSYPTSTTFWLEWALQKLGAEHVIPISSAYSSQTYGLCVPRQIRGMDLSGPLRWLVSAPSQQQALPFVFLEPSSESVATEPSSCNDTPVGPQLRRSFNQLSGKFFTVYLDFPLDSAESLTELSLLCRPPPYFAATSESGPNVISTELGGRAWSLVETDLLNSGRMLKRRFRDVAVQAFGLSSLKKIDPQNFVERRNCKLRMLGALRRSDALIIAPYGTDALNGGAHSRMSYRSRMIAAAQLRSGLASPGRDAVCVDHTVASIFVVDFDREFSRTLEQLETLLSLNPSAHVTLLLASDDVWDVGNATQLLDYWKCVKWQAFELDAGLQQIPRAASTFSARCWPLCLHPLRAVQRQDLRALRHISESETAPQRAPVARTLQSIMPVPPKSLQSLFGQLRQLPPTRQAQVMGALRSLVAEERIGRHHRATVSCSIEWSTDPGLNVAGSFRPIPQTRVFQPIGSFSMLQILSFAAVDRIYNSLLALADQQGRSQQCTLSYVAPVRSLSDVGLLFSYSLADALVHQTRLYIAEPKMDGYLCCLIASSGILMIQPRRAGTIPNFNGELWHCISRNDALKRWLESPRLKKPPISRTKLWDLTSADQGTYSHRAASVALDSTWNLAHMINSISQKAGRVAGERPALNLAVTLVHVSLPHNRGSISGLQLSTEMALGHCRRLTELECTCSSCLGSLRDRQPSILLMHDSDEVRHGRYALNLALAERSVNALIVYLALSEYSACVTRLPDCPTHVVAPTMLMQMVNRAIAHLGNWCQAAAPANPHPGNGAEFLRTARTLLLQERLRRKIAICRVVELAELRQLSEAILKGLGCNLVFLEEYVYARRYQKYPPMNATLHRYLAQWWLFLSCCFPLLASLNSSAHQIVKETAFEAAKCGAFELHLIEEKRTIYRNSIVTAQPKLPPWSAAALQRIWQLYERYLTSSQAILPSPLAHNTESSDLGISSRPPSSGRDLPAPSILPPAATPSPQPLPIVALQQASPPIMEDQALEPISEEEIVPSSKTSSAPDTPPQKAADAPDATSSPGLRESETAGDNFELVIPPPKAKSDSPIPHTSLNGTSPARATFATSTETAQLRRTASSIQGAGSLTTPPRRSTELIEIDDDSAASQSNHSDSQEASATPASAREEASPTPTASPPTHSEVMHDGTTDDDECQIISIELSPATAAMQRSLNEIGNSKDRATMTPHGDLWLRRLISGKKIYSVQANGFLVEARPV